MDCQEAGLNYWAVSDINEKELQESKQLFEEQIVPHKFDQALDLSIRC